MLNSELLLYATRPMFSFCKLICLLAGFGVNFLVYLLAACLPWLIVYDVLRVVEARNAS